MKKRIMPVVLGVFLLVLLAAMPMMAAADETGSSVYLDGQPVSSVVLLQDETLQLEATPGAGSYRWQIRVAGIWADILGETSSRMTLSYGMVANALDFSDTTAVRCITGDTCSETVEVSVEYTFGVAEASFASFSLMGGEEEEAQPVSEETAVVTVEHHCQNVSNDGYTLAETTTVEVPVGSVLGSALYQSYEGFYAMPYDANMVVEGDISLGIYYNRYYFLMLFELDGGTGVEPIYGRYGESVSVGTPTREGFTFNGWEPAVPATIPMPYSGYSTTYTAKWINPKSVQYTVVYWGENPNDDGYSVLGTSTAKTTAGITVSGSNNIPTSMLASAEKKYYTYNDQKTDKNVVVQGDGLTMVNVYYDRNVYTVHFVGNDESDKLKMRTQCTLNHTHSATCTEWHTYNVIYTLQAKYGADITGLWPTAAHLEAVKDKIHPDDQKNISQLRGWSYLKQDTENKILNGKITDSNISFSNGDQTTWASIQTEMNSNLCDTDNNGVKYAIAMMGRSLTTYTLHYMVESFDQKSGENAATFRKKYNSLYYDREAVETVSISGSWSTQKSIPGYTSNGYKTSGTDIFLYYTRKSVNFAVYSEDTTVLKPVSTKVGKLLKEVNIGSTPLGEYEPPYPEGYEAGTREFLGWCTSMEDPAGTLVDINTLKMPETALTLFAYWARIERTVTIYRDEMALVNGDVLYGPHVVGHGSKLEPAPEEPADDELTFVGWFYRKDGVEVAFDFNNMAVVRNMDVYGKWGAFDPAAYTLRYVAPDGATEVADPDKAYLLPGSFIEVEAKPLKDLYAGYDQVLRLPEEATGSMLIEVDPKENVYTFVYREEDAVISYAAAGAADAGTLSVTEETVAVLSGETEGSVPTAEEGYRFAGWYLDEACTLPVPAAWVQDGVIRPKPAKIYAPGVVGYDLDGATYYAKFTEDAVKLTVSVSVTGADENFLFHVVRVDSGEPVFLTIAMENGGSVTICDLPAGTYKITEVSGWTWRFGGNVSRTMAVTADAVCSFTDADFGTPSSVWMNDYSLLVQ